jgi:hypothetical protein
MYAGELTVRNEARKKWRIGGKVQGITLRTYIGLETKRKSQKATHDGVTDKLLRLV